MADRTELTIEIAVAFVGLVSGLSASWKRAFLRFRYEPDEYGSNGSYEDDTGIVLIDAVANGNAFERINELAARLFALMAVRQGVGLLVTDAALNYEIKFEYDDLERWKITKLDGGTGIPRGLD